MSTTKTDQRARVSALLKCHNEAEREETVSVILDHYVDFIAVAEETGSRFWLDEHGVLRWEPDPLVNYLHETFIGNPSLRQFHDGLNDMWTDMLWKRGLTEKQMRRYYRGIGYSLCGYADVWHDGRGGIAEPKAKT